MGPRLWQSRHRVREPGPLPDDDGEPRFTVGIHPQDLRDPVRPIAPDRGRCCCRRDRPSHRPLLRVIPCRVGPLHRPHPPALYL